MVRPRAALDGLTSIEVGMEFPWSFAGYSGEAFVLVRVREGSAAEGALPASASWQRGRRVDERVAVFRLGIPSSAACVRLVQRLAKLLQNPNGEARRGRENTRIDSRFAVASPAQAADAA